MPNGLAWSPIFPLLKPMGALVSILYVRDTQRYLLRREERLLLALASQRLPALAQRLPLLQTVPPGRNMGKAAPSHTQADESASQEKPSAKRRDSR